MEEAFSKIISSVVEHEFIFGTQVGEATASSLNIYNLLFADDTLSFCGSNLDQIQAFRASNYALKLY